MMKKAATLLLGVMTLVTCAYGNTAEQQEVQPIQTELKARLPEWRPRIFEHFPNGSPRLVIF